jgi:hypothetical protein
MSDEILSTTMQTMLATTLLTSVLIPLFNRMLDHTGKSFEESFYPTNLLKNITLGKENSMEITYAANWDLRYLRFIALTGTTHNQHLIKAVIDFLKQKNVPMQSTNLILEEPSHMLFSLEALENTNDPKVLQKYFADGIPITHPVQYQGINIICSLNNSNNSNASDKASNEADKMANVSVKITMRISSRTKSYYELKQFMMQCYKDYITHKAILLNNSDRQIYYSQLKLNEESIYPYFVKFEMPPKIQRSCSKISPYSEKRHAAFRYVYLSDKIVLGIQRLIDHVNQGLSNKAIFFITGIPGSGKTTLIRAISEYANRHIVACKLSITSTNDMLMNIFHGDSMYICKEGIISLEPYKRILLFEEIDADTDILHERTKLIDKKSDSTNQSLALLTAAMIQSQKSSSSKNDSSSHGSLNSNTKPNLEGWLTTIDGSLPLNKVIAAITANHPDLLDEAVTRQGRVSLKLHLEEIQTDDARHMLQDFFPEDIIPENLVLDGELSGAELEGLCQRSSSLEELIKDLPKVKIDYKNTRREIQEAKQLEKSVIEAQRQKKLQDAMEVLSKKDDKNDKDNKSEKILSR